MPEVFGINGIFQAYKHAIKGSRLAGPTFFAPCLRIIVNYVMSRLKEYVYHIFLILTDGEIHDMEQTMDLIV